MTHRTMTVDVTMLKSVSKAMMGLKPTAKDKIIFMVMGNSYLLSDDKDENLSLKGAYHAKHLTNPERLQQEDLTSLVAKVARTVNDTKVNYPGILLYLDPCLDMWSVASSTVT